MKPKAYLVVVAFAGFLGSTITQAQNPPKMKMTTPIPQSITTPDSVDTRIGKIAVESGYPSKESIDKLIDETDYQRACQAYVWGLPIVGIAEWQKSREQISKVRNGQFELFLSFDEKLGIMTPNFDTPYFIATADLEKSGPLVIEMPKGPIAGMVMDTWQRSLSDLGVVGPDKGKGGKYLILGPGQEDPKAEGYIVLRSTTKKVFFGGRCWIQTGSVRCASWFPVCGHTPTANAPTRPKSRWCPPGTASGARSRRLAWPIGKLWRARSPTSRYRSATGFSLRCSSRLASRPASPLRPPPDRRTS